MSVRRSGAAALLITAVGLTGCLGSLKKHAGVAAVTLAPVADQAKAVYAEANAVHEMREDWDAVQEFDRKEPVYDPRRARPLISEEGLETRLAVMEAMQCYVQKLKTILEGTESKELDAAAKEAGGNLKTMVDATGSAKNPVMSATGSALATTGIEVLGDFLVRGVIRKELPETVIKMEPVVEKVVATMTAELETIRSAEKLDFDRLIDEQVRYVREHSAGPAGEGRQREGEPLAAGEREEMIRKLPELARRQRADEEGLERLKEALDKFAKAHAALAKDARGEDPGSLKAKLDEAVEAGEHVGKFYVAQ